MTGTPPRRRALRWTLPVAVLLGAALVGVGTGGTLALWRAELSGTARMPVGVTVFGVGAPGATKTYATVDGQSLTVEFGKEEAAVLLGTPEEGGAVAIPVEVDSLSQGHRGLSYTVTPSISGGVFGASRWRLLKLDPGVTCSTSATGAEVTSSHPWTTAYDATSTLRTEQWCLVARFVPVTGEHTNTATVTGTPDVPDAPRSVTDSDTWRTTVRQTLVAAAEPTHRLTFTFATSRPGGAS